ncbi:MAG TPA: caspase family protein, partial [Burkholderiaceae bacterium]|nr:caspase family protein [Burkholderiaceae bacterium]
MRGVSLVEDRIALVIGNAAYKRDALDNPVNDARLIARTLEKATFQV